MKLSTILSGSNHHKTSFITLLKLSFFFSPHKAEDNSLTLHEIQFSMTYAVDDEYFDHDYDDDDSDHDNDVDDDDLDGNTDPPMIHQGPTVRMPAWAL